MGEDDLKNLFNQEVMEAIKAIPSLKTSIEIGFKDTHEKLIDHEKRIKKVESVTTRNFAIIGTIMAGYEGAKAWFFNR